jgi:dTDP-4-dehydrorhamnose 3,5-epimerase
MKIVELRLSRLIVIEPDVRRDERGFFVEAYRRSAYEEAGVDADFVQDNHSRSKRGTLRGLHFQSEPGQPKLIRSARGRILDVVVDIRRSSPTFGQHEAVELDDESHRQLYVPVGFAHGFCVLSEAADVVYKVGSYYNPATEVGIAWDDPDLAIAWPVLEPQLSDRDRNQPRLRDILHLLPEL